MEPDLIHITLARAERPLDLWAVMEAAQFGRIMQAEEEARLAEQETIAGFESALSERAEEWELTDDRQRPSLLGRLERPLKSLADRALFLHCGIAECRVALESGESRQLPLAVLHIGYSDAPELEAALPRHLTATS